MAITIEALQATVLPSREHVVPAMKDGITVKLTVGQILDLLVDGAPETLDTLNEIAVALNDDANLAATLTAAISARLEKTQNLNDLADKQTAIDNLFSALRTVRDDPFVFADPATPSKRVAIKATNVSAGQTRTLTMPDANVLITSFIATLLAAADVAAARTTLGLGTAAIVNTGTSGTTIPLLNAQNVFGDTQKISRVGGPALRVHVNAVADDAIFFRTPDDASNRGSITHPNASATNYVTSSDHRLKRDRGPLVGFWDRIMSVIPRAFTWIVDDLDGAGFFAHEFQPYYPQSVTGQPDQVDEGGTPVYQSMQPSTPEVMADVFAALQDVKNRLDAAGL
ncbi:MULTISPECIES: hypothetical protein [unclassified Sinorhizobium]|uniref:hypothetical protein n=1 Tax=unclassified Sinorhizobium TaxID=2613772 RepID=UPI003526869B